MLQRKKSVAVLLSIFLGWVGADRFYLGYKVSGFLKVLCFSGFLGGAFGFPLWNLFRIVWLVWGGLDCVLIISNQLLPKGCSSWISNGAEIEKTERN